MTFGRDTASVIVPAARALVVNCGSSSVKCALVDPASGERSFSRNEPTSRARPAEVVAGILESLGETELRSVVGCGHRIVHGGTRFIEPVLVDDDVRGALAEISELAPLHAPANLAGIDAARTALPGVPQVAVFDTAFHHTLPPRAYRYAVPQEWFASAIAM
jgi:acetate kinase